MRYVILLIYLLCSCSSLQAEISIIPDRGYFDTVQKLIASAERSIEVEMYLVYSNNFQVRELLDEIIKAKKRGVRVNILLEDGQEENKVSLEYLRDRGVRAQFDEPETKLHAKQIFVDGKRLVIGSSNWTKSAFDKNNESNVLLDLEEDKDKIQILRTDYADKLLEAIDSAKKEIDIIIYSFQFENGRENKSYELMSALLRACDRGCKIRILFDSWREDSKNEPAYQVLEQAGAEVYYDLNTIATHNKLVVIDNEIVFLGSANWTTTGLIKNREASILIRDPPTSRRYNAYIDELIDSLPERSEVNVPIPVSFLKKDGILWKLYRKDARQGIKLYCWFIWEAFNKQTFILKRDYKKWYEVIYGKPALPWIRSKRDNISKIVRRLTEDAIKRERKEDKIILVDFINIGKDWKETECILVPPEFWTLGWVRKLSCSELYFYLVNLVEFKRSPYKPVWINSQENLSREYGVDRMTIQRSFKKLMYNNLLEIKHDIPDPGQPFNTKRANRYFINHLWSEEELDRKWKKSAKRHGQDLFQKARDLAKRINEPYDPKIVSSFILLIKIYGEEAVTEVIDKVTRLTFENGKWEMRYIVGILQRDHTTISSDKAGINLP